MCTKKLKVFYDILNKMFEYLKYGEKLHRFAYSNNFVFSWDSLFHGILVYFLISYKITS